MTYIIIGLPADGLLNTVDILSFLRKRVPFTENIEIPKFSFEHLDSLLSVSDLLEKLDDTTGQMFKTFLSRCTSEVFVNEQNLDYNVKTFKWSPSKYEPCCISKIAEKMEKDISLFKETMNTRFTNYEKACKTIEFAFKENRGPLREIDIEMSEHEFLIEHYVIVHKARKKISKN